MKFLEDQVSRCSDGVETVYQMIKTEAVTLKCDQYPDAYSVVILCVEGDAVTESGIVYDLTRDPIRCRRIMREMARVGAVPRNARSIAEELL